MDHTALREICKLAGLDPFDYDGSRTRSREETAERLTAGRTNYFAAGTRSFFGCRVAHIQSFGSVVLGVVESVKGDFEGARRVYRPTFFGVDGYVIERPKFDESFRTAKQARAEFERIAGRLDLAAELRAAIERQSLQHQRALESLKQALSHLPPVAA